MKKKSLKKLQNYQLKHWFQNYNHKINIIPKNNPIRSNLKHDSLIKPKNSVLIKFSLKVNRTLLNIILKRKLTFKQIQKVKNHWKFHQIKRIKSNTQVQKMIWRTKKLFNKWIQKVRKI